jgi:hypothetical protein
MLLLTALLAGCALAPLQEADCRSGDWRGRGYADGYAGAHPQDMRLIPECRSRYGMEIDRAEYLKGWEAGHDEWERLIGSRKKVN